MKTYKYKMLNTLSIGEIVDKLLFFMSLLSFIYWNFFSWFQKNFKSFS